MEKIIRDVMLQKRSMTLIGSNIKTKIIKKKKVEIKCTKKKMLASISKTNKKELPRMMCEVLKNVKNKCLKKDPRTERGIAENSK